MSKHLSSVKNAKDKYTLSNLDDLDLAMRAEARYAKRQEILAPRKPIRLTMFGMFIAGLCAGALLTALAIFVMRTSGPVAGLALAFGTGIIFAVIGINMKDDK